ncbi:MAG: 3'-5' exonuclease [Bacteroidia bacterium]
MNLPSEIVFIDIETVSAYPALEKAPKQEQVFWKIKESQLNSRVQESTATYERAGIYAEFGKIICVCCGVLQKEEDEVFLKINTFSSNNEKSLLEAFINYLSLFGDASILCAHNGKEFDYPYLCRRMLINHLAIPSTLKIAGKKPWELKHLDTLELWKFGDYKHYSSLDLLAKVFGVPSSKKELNGSMVNEYYYKKKDLKSIRNYCENDIVTLVCVYLNLISKTEWLPKHIEVERSL